MKIEKNVDASKVSFSLEAYGAGGQGFYCHAGCCRCPHRFTRQSRQGAVKEYPPDTPGSCQIKCK